MYPWVLLTQEAAAAGVLRSMAAMTAQQGAFPRWTLGGHEASCMVGSHGAAMVAEALLARTTGSSGSAGSKAGGSTGSNAGGSTSSKTGDFKATVAKASAGSKARGGATTASNAEAAAGDACGTMDAVATAVGAAVQPVLEAMATEPVPRNGRTDLAHYLDRGFVASEASDSSVSLTLTYAFDDGVLATITEQVRRIPHRHTSSRHSPRGRSQRCWLSFDASTQACANIPTAAAAAAITIATTTETPE